MNNLELDAKFSLLVKSERKITREVLELIVIAERQRLPEQRGFKDTYDWLIRGHGYSGGAANRRIQASRLLREIPELAAKVESGALNLTSLWQTQKTIRAQQKASGQKIATCEKIIALQRIENKTTEMAARELDTLFPDGIQSAEKVVHKQGGGLRIVVELNQEEAQEFERSRELLSHAIPEVNFGRVIARLAKEFNDHKDPSRKPQCATTPQRGTTQNRRSLIQQAGGKCGYRDARSGRICGSRYQLEIDHLIPRAKGGTDDPSNLRCLCRRHNQLMAEFEFGRKFIESKRLSSSG